MKRFYISLIIFVILLGLSGYSLYHVYNTRQEILEKTDQMIATAERGDMEQAYELALDFSSYWEDEEEQLVRYVRHGELDSITSAVARLPYLAKYYNLSEYLAEANLVRSIVDHIWESEIPAIRNIL